MRLLITGGAGFIGSHLCDFFVARGERVVCLDNFFTGSITNIRHLLDKRNFKIIKGDVRDRELLDKQTRDVDAILHLAAQIHVDRSYIEPELTWDVNVRGTQNVLESARVNDVPHVIFASSSEVYGSAISDEPISENHPLNAPHPYGASKIAGDRMCYSYSKTFGMNVSIMRCFNIFGPRQRDLGYGGVIAIFAKRIFEGKAPVIYGDGSQKRDYTYVSDIVQAYSKVLSGSYADPVNFGTGVSVTIENIACGILKEFGSKCEPVHIAPRIAEVQNLIADASRAKAVYGWEAQVGIDEGISSFVEWYKQYGTMERLT